MTLEYVSEILKIKKETQELEEMIDRLDRKERVVDVVRGSMIQFPYIEKRIYVEGTKSEENPIVNKLKKVLVKKYICILEVIIDIEKFIDKFDSSSGRVATQMKFIDGKTWTNISKKLYGKESNESTSRMESIRCIRKYANKDKRKKAETPN